MEPKHLVAIGVTILVLVLVMYVPRWLHSKKFVSASELRDRIKQKDDMVIIDVRTEEEFRGDLGHIKGALNLPLNQIEKRLDDLEEDLKPFRELPVYVVCRTDRRALSGASMISREGFKNVFILEGGMAGWNRENFPITR